MTSDHMAEPPSNVVAALRQAEAALERLRAHDVRVSVDDFGMGHSCLSLLHTVPIDTLKIDRSFVARIGPDGTSPATVRTVVALAHSLGMVAVAEGVEGKGPLPAEGATETLQEARRW